MTDRYGLKSSVIEKIQAVFAKFDAITSVILYGSRAKGNFKIGSDIDLALKTHGVLPPSLLSDVSSAIDELDLIYSFDISLYEQIDNENLLEHIDRVGIEFYNATEYVNQ